MKIEILTLLINSITFIILLISLIQTIRNNKKRKQEQIKLSKQEQEYIRHDIEILQQLFNIKEE